jgi:DNA (cytosine-5)-methyltransferase 1
VSKISVLSLFSGCGGADLGLLGGFTYLDKRYKRLPFLIRHSSDINERAVKTYNSNFKHKAIVADIAELSFSDLDVDMVVGGFPCQPFSTVNPTKNPDLKESQLFWEMARVVDVTRPKVIVAENVKGFYRLKNGYYFNLACKEFSRLGYDIYHNLLNSSHYGIPQKRERIIIVGIHKSLKKNFNFPAPTHGTDKRPFVPLSRVITSLIPADPKYYFSKKAVEGVKKAKPNMKRALAQDLDAPCLTITSHLAKVSLNSRDPVLIVDREKELYRRFTPEEAAAIQSFPPEFTFLGSESDAYRQIGNAIPPVLMWHIANQIYLQIFKDVQS